MRLKRVIKGHTSWVRLPAGRGCQRTRTRSRTSSSRRSAAPRQGVAAQEGSAAEAVGTQRESQGWGKQRRSWLLRVCRMRQLATVNTFWFRVIQEEWKKTVVPKIQQLKKQLGAKWQEKAPLVAAALKKQAGVYFNKAVQFVNQQLSKGR